MARTYLERILLRKPNRAISKGIYSLVALQAELLIPSIQAPINSIPEKSRDEIIMLSGMRLMLHQSLCSF
jgi:hypothetical protein